MGEPRRRRAGPAHNVTGPEWLAAAECLDHMVIQTMLLRGRIENTTPAELPALRATYRRLGPREVRLLTLNKPTLRPGLQPVPRPDLAEYQRLFGETATCHAYA